MHAYNKEIVMKQFGKMVVVLLTLSFCINGQAQQVSSGIENVDARKFKQLVDEGQGIILDVRTPEEVAGGHINNASAINLYDKDFNEKINLIQKDKPIFVYCKLGGRGAKAAELLQQNGFARIYNLAGGIVAWENSGYPIVKPKASKDEKIQQMSLSDFKKLLATDKPVLVDFHTRWCAPCMKMAPVVDGIAQKYAGHAVVVRIDVDQSKELGKAYKIQGVPVFILFKKGEEKWKHNGTIPEEELNKKIEEYL